jgi:hypothetical protein
MKRVKGSHLLKYFGLFAFFFVAATRVHMRVHTTLIGYELGRLKNHEAELLEERSFLKMELARLTTKSQLSLLANSRDDEASHLGSLASK